MEAQAAADEGPKGHAGGVTKLNRYTGYMSQPAFRLCNDVTYATYVTFCYTGSPADGTRRPSLNSCTRPMRWARSRAWVTTIRVTPSSRFRSSSNWPSAWAEAWSSEPVGSSDRKSVV